MNTIGDAVLAHLAEVKSKIRSLRVEEESLVQQCKTLYKAGNSRQVIEADNNGLFVALGGNTYRPGHPSKLEKGLSIKVVFGNNRPGSVEVRIKGVVENWYLSK